MAVVTIRGPLGSGAPDVGKQIAALLHADYIDRELIGKVAASLNRPEQAVQEKDMPPGTLFGRIAEALGNAFSYTTSIEAPLISMAEMPLNDSAYCETLESVVKHLARSEPIVICGRGSQFILKDHPSAFHILVVAPLEIRIERVKKNLNLSREAAAKEIERFDNSIRAFVKRYFHADLDDAVHYDLVINTGRLRFEDAASLAVRAESLKKPR